MKFFLCKHLTSGHDCPRYHEVNLNRSPPFIIIDKNSARRRANIDHEDFTDGEFDNLNESFVESNIDINLYHNENNDTSSDADQESKEIGEEIENHIKWLLERIQQLRAHASGYAQIAHLERNFLPRLKTYRQNILSSENRRTITQTFENVDTIF